MATEPIKVEDVLELQLKLAKFVDTDLNKQINKFGEKSDNPNFQKLLMVSRDVQGAINNLGKVIESFDKQ